MTQPTADGDRLPREAYASDANLAARRSIYQYQVPRHDLVALGLRHIPARAQTILDLGCGNGQYLRRLASEGLPRRLAGLDLSLGMLREAATGSSGAIAFVAGDAQRLPFVSSGFDAVLAMHMLYHVPDIQLAVAEMRRVLHDDGMAVVITNGIDHFVTLWKIYQRAVSEVCGSGAPDPRSATRFSADNARDFLEAHFEVSSTSYHALVSVPSPEPVVAYVRSLSAFLEPLLPHGCAWDEVCAAAGALIEESVRRDGVWTTLTATTIFACRPIAQ